MQSNIQKQREEREEKYLLPQKRACASINLLIKILDHENHGSIFLCVENFEGGSPDSVGIQDQKKILQHLQAYANFYTLIYDNEFRYSEPLASSILREKSPWVSLAALFERMQEAPVDQESVYAVKGLFASLAEDMQVLLTEAKKQKLLGLEVKHASFFHLLSQLEMSFDHQIIGLSFPDFSPLRVVIQRHLINIYNCPLTIPHHVPIQSSKLYMRRKHFFFDG